MPTAPIVSVFPGSSPLTRGKHLAQLAGHFRPGLIPAHAGKTHRGGPPSLRPRAHPRSRGENGEQTTLRRCHQGSSPLTRGKPFARVAPPAPTGLIPAHAGKTLSSRKVARPIRAHPRSRGENGCLPGHPDDGAGSSPLTRGKHPDVRAGRRRSGLIPAHAGKTVCVRARSAIVRAHPRSRGENTTVGTMPGAGPGSSPLTRGKLRVFPPVGRVCGLIPAHAGKTPESPPP